MLNKIRIHGASDDLCEIDGAMNEEFGCSSPMFLRFTNGVHVKVEYSPAMNAIWQIDILSPGYAQLVQKIQTGEEGTKAKPERDINGVCSYSDCVEVIDLLPIELYKKSDRPIPEPTTADLIAAKVVKTLVAKDYIQEDDEVFDDVLSIISTAIAANLSTATPIKSP